MTPQTLQTLSQVAIVVGIVLTGLGGFGAYYYGKVMDEAQEAAAAEREAALKADLGKLLVGNESLQKRLEPFEQLARQLHPNVGRDEAMERLREDLEGVKKRATALEGRVAPRALSDQQRQALVAALRSGPPRSIEISAVMGDTEAFALAGELKAALEAAGWKVDGVNQSIFNVPVRGLVISVGRQPPPSTANELFRALQKAGYPITGNLDPNKKDDTVSLWVGSK